MAPNEATPWADFRAPSTSEMAPWALPCARLDWPAFPKRTIPRRPPSRGPRTRGVVTLQGPSDLTLLSWAPFRRQRDWSWNVSRDPGKCLTRCLASYPRSDVAWACPGEASVAATPQRGASHGAHAGLAVPVRSLHWKGRPRASAPGPCWRARTAAGTAFVRAR